MLRKEWKLIMLLSGSIPIEYDWFLATTTAVEMSHTSSRDWLRGYFSFLRFHYFFHTWSICLFVLLKNNFGVVFLIKVFIHPNFVKKTFNNDIALVKMRSEVSFNWCHFINPCWYINLVFLFFYCLFDISSWVWIRSVSWAKLSYFFVMCKTNPK